MNYEKLLQPGRIGNMDIRNRMIMPGMGTNLAAADGTVSDVIVNYYARRANGGVGMIITEVCCPDPLGKVIHGEIEATADVFMPGLSRIPHAIHSGGAKACLQLAHGGCFASESVTGEPPMTPSGVGTFLLPGENPRTMTVEEIHHLIEQYAQAARRAKDCCFDAVEIHGAHGYLPLQFLSAYTNRRTDEYGGSLENRARFALEIIKKVREYAGKDLNIIYRLSGEEYVPNGLTIEEACEFAKMAQEAGADAINVSAGTWDSRMEKFGAVMSGQKSAEGMELSHGVGISTWVPPNYTPRGTMVHLAAAIKKAVSIPVIAVCSISPEMGEEILEKNDADFIAMGRQTIADPDYPNKIKEERSNEIRRCLRCNECLGDVMRNNGISCAINPEAGKEYEGFTQVHPVKKVKNVAIIGAGPAGMQAALTATQRGHEVTLFEKNNKLGGALYYVSIPDFKIDYREYTNYMIEATKACGATIKTGVEVTPEIIKQGGYDTVIVATGATTFIPNIPGSKDTTILDPLLVLDSKQDTGKTVVVCGAGLVGCEVAMFLAEQGREVTMVDMLASAAPDMNVFSKWVLEGKLAELGIKVKTNHKINELTGKSVSCEFEGQSVKYEADSVICALGLRSSNAIVEELRVNCKGVDIIPVGDVNKPRKIMQATHEGFHAARRI